MRLIDRYLLRELLIPLGYILGALFLLWIAFDLFNDLDIFRANKLTTEDIAQYYLVKTPEMLVVVAPVSLLLAMLYALTNHARHHELVAIRAAGVSLWRLSMPYFAVGLFLSTALFVLNELVAPNGADWADQILTRYTVISAPEELQWRHNLNFSNERAGRLWSMNAYNTNTYEMRKVSVSWTQTNGASRMIIADRASRTNGVWTFFEATQFSYKSADDPVPLTEKTNELVMAEFWESPELIKSEIKVNGMTSARAMKKSRFTLKEIFAYKRLHPLLKPDMHAMLHTQLHERFATPCEALVVVLITLPFGAMTGRRSVVVGVASSIVICFTFFVLANLGLALGTSGRVTPWLAAWLPNLVFAGGGVWFTLRAR